ncbi:LOW QUALITY PROTEIN: protein Brevis radix-like 1 [Ananas comosus]|uniref:LOW QUALITY PROTEIN: protein Brevis radix-like 1 n=1 Tax=Ananas comosus TaxID=4615 RepID=A0A6P5FC00_ANACO|nr:LOW QUALITY PROTEIN: protein Brevis radix-like 1 [Ananas comosus]
MLTCIACSKQLGGGSLRDDPPEDDDAATPSTRQAIKALTAQIKDMALKASGAYRHCKPCAGSATARHHHHHRYADSEAASGSERFHYAYRRAGGGSASAGRARLRGAAAAAAAAAALSSGDATPSMSGRTDSESAAGRRRRGVHGGGGGGGAAEEEEEEAKEWVAQVEPGVLITFVSLAHGGNDLKRIRFSREMFNKWQAQRWWAENYDKVMELYNVQRFNRQAVPLPTPPRSEDESSKEDSPVTPPLGKERLPRNFQRPVTGGGGMGYSSSDSFEHHSSHHGNGNHHQHHHHHHGHGRHYNDSCGLASTPKLSSISGAKTETSSVDASLRTSSSHDEADRSGELSVSVSNASDQEREWVEEDEPGVYITIRALPGGMRELRRVRFSRERFSEMHARLWWEENRARIHEQYL